MFAEFYTATSQFLGRFVFHENLVPASWSAAHNLAEWFWTELGLWRSPVNVLLELAEFIVERFDTWALEWIPDPPEYDDPPGYVGVPQRVTSTATTSGSGAAAGEQRVSGRRGCRRSPTS